MNETAGFYHRSVNETTDENDTEFDGIFWLKETGIDDPDDDFLKSYEFDAVIDVLDSVDLEFNGGDQIYRSHDKSTWDVIINYKIHGEIRVLLFKQEQTMIGMH